MPPKNKFFTKIFDQYIDKIYRFIFLRTDSESTAQDLTQQVFLKFWEKIDGVQNPKAFLYKVAKDTVSDYYRQKSKFQPILLEEISFADPENPEEKVLIDFELERIKKALQTINEDYQNVIVWHYLDDLSIKEIAKILDKSEGTVRVLLHRALKALKGKLLKEI